jgi:S-ribosylhomocysteine lyase
MEKIASFQIDHDLLEPGIYLSRIDMGDIFTYDLRFKFPNAGDFLAPAAAHTVEHIFATYVRSSAIGDKVVYFGPMGCLTGNYLIVKGTPTPEEICPLVIAAFESLRDWQSDVPGATAVNCGNYLLHDLAMAKWESARYVEILESSPCFEYPSVERTVVPGSGALFHDS